MVLVEGPSTPNLHRQPRTSLIAPPLRSNWNPSCYVRPRTGSATSMPTDKDRIIVVGAGPVGLTAALALGRRGIPTVLLAAEPELVMELRGSTFHPPTLDLLDEFAVVPSMIEAGLKAPTWQFRDRETGPVATFDLSLLAD